ncbi:MAG: ubiquitin-like protein Pup [Patescibacteria group bacterium]
MSEKREKRQIRTSDREKEKIEDNPIDKEKAQKVKEDMDKLIDEIDDVLEKNSEEFIKSYVQKGGE